MIGKNLLWVAKNHGHSVTTMLTDYAAWIEEAQDADIEAIHELQPIVQAANTLSNRHCRLT